MNLVVFGLVVVAYLAAFAKDRTNALAGAALLLPFHAYLSTLDISLANLHTLIMLCLLLAVLMPSQRNDRPVPRPPAALIVFVLIFMIGYVHSLFGELPFGQLERYEKMKWPLFVAFKDRLSVLFICYAAFKLAKDAETVRKVFWAAVLGFGIEIAFSMTEFVLKSGTVTGHFGKRGPMSTFLATYAVLSIGVFIALKGNRRRRLFLALGIAGAIAAVGARSRGGLLALGGSMLAVSLWKNRILFVLLLTAALTYQMWMPTRMLARFDEAYDTSETGGVLPGAEAIGADDVEIAIGEIVIRGTAADRLKIWQAGLRTIPDYPFGIGLGRFPLIVPGYGLEGLFKAKNAHNEVVLFLVELGVLGLAAYLWLLASLALRARRVYRHDPDPLIRAMGLGALVGLVGAFFASMVVTMLLRSEVSGILWLLLGMCARRAGEIDLRALPPQVPRYGRQLTPDGGMQT